MAEWIEKRMEDIADFNPRESLIKGSVAKKIAMDKLQPFCRDIPNFEIESFFGGTKFRNNDTIMARITPCLENGKTAKVNILEEDEIGFGSTEFMVFRAKEETDPDFLYYLIISPIIREPAIKSMVGSSGRQRVQTDVVQKLMVRVPDLNTQRAIAGILKSLDDKIAENRKINNNLEQQAMALFKSWFIDYEPFDGQMPTTWKSGVLGNFVEIKRGGSPRPIQNFLSDSGLHWLKISDATCISSPFINEIKEYIIEDGLKKTVFLKAGNLVLSNSATPGLPKILDIDTCIHDGWLYFPSSKFSNEYLYLYFKHIRDNLVALGNGSVFTNLKTDILKNYPTNLPTDDVLSKFDEIIKPMFSMILSKTRESKALMEIRDSLLPKLISGELDVSDIDL
ncbi:restriction endonuclease subunit S [Roseburia sp. OM04-10AA]|uniref:restriction endonuclease subunit S n=2 Tax=Roseburia TaxID=841 RepID=UPI000E4C3A45|nr:restriction endonuclease subunit S [Roseburia sp. OM04-10AA]RHV59273.1 restriction endonuclease subunit S [Roseburia sp. OM04-10AA]